MLGGLQRGSGGDGLLPPFQASKTRETWIESPSPSLVLRLFVSSTEQMSLVKRKSTDILLVPSGRDTSILVIRGESEEAG
mmetsp:Transcript_55794/g.109233  ORF Transcript_55794/g.109233 Transcript_55794/m.109233 type:complete len:80 (+) Transcript_55794:980-1219(+)